MDTVFPFGLPGPTAFYLTLLVATFALHQALVHYVIAGTLYVAGATLVGRRWQASLDQQSLSALLRDWMPFVLSAAITAGVAPLLFIQIVYPRHFYTANLLLSWRWMVMIPVLIAAFYLLYVMKSSAIANASRVLRSAVAIATAACFLFVGFCWTGNHLVASDEPRWQEIFASGRIDLPATTVLLRLLVWLGGSFASMALIVGWQWMCRPKDAMNGDRGDEVGRLALLASGGLVIAALAGGVLIAQAGETARGHLLGRFAGPYLALATVGLVTQVALWSVQWRSKRLQAKWLVVASVAAALTLLAVAVLRESIRLSTIDVASLYPRHEQASSMGGLSVFAVLALVNGALIAGCVWLVRRGLTPPGRP